MCMVTPVLGGTVKSLSEMFGAGSNNRRLPLPLAKHIALHMVRGVSHSHNREVIHTDLKHDNIFFANHMDERGLQDLLVSDPARLNPPELSLHGTVRSAVSQPLPPPSTVEDALKLNFVVADFGNGKPYFTSASLRAQMISGSPAHHRPPS